jgi:hypothetical protein
MKRSKALFMLKFAKQNLVKSPLRSFLMLLGFTFLMVVLTLSFTMQDVLKHYYYYRYERMSEHIDLEMTIGSNSTSRYFSTRTLDENYVGTYSRVFKIDVLTDDYDYLTVLATSKSDFEVIYGSYHDLLDNEIILTETAAKTHQVGVSDTLTLSLGQTQKSFVVKYILKDYGVFQGDKGFILHDPHVGLFIKAMFPALSNYPDAFFVNLNNTVYFDTDNIAQTQAMIQNLSAYQSMDFKLSLPVQYINQLINRAIALFQLMLLFIGITVVLLIQTTYALVFREKEQMLSLIKLLGGSLWFGFFIWLFELFILYIPAAILGYGLAYGIIQIGMQVLMPGLIYPLSFLPILYSIGILTVIFILTVLYHTLRWQSKTEVSRLKVVPDKKVSTWVHGLWVGIGSLCYIILPSEGTLYTVIRLVLVLSMTYALLILIHRFWIKQVNLFKETPFPYLMKISYHKKTLYRFLWLSLATLISVTLLFETTGYIRYKANVILNEYQADLVLSNVLTNVSQIQAELGTNPLVENSSPVGIYRSVSIKEGNQVFQAVYMLDPDVIPQYFGMTHVDDLMTFQNSTEPSIWLPMRYQAIYGVNVGDTVHIGLTNTHQDVPLKVQGFFDEAVGNTAFINLHRVSGYSDLKQTHILINTSDPQMLKNQLIHTYSSRLYYVYDFQLNARNLSHEVIQSMNYATFVTLIILAGLLLSMMNQGMILFYELKPSYVRASILGLSNRTLKTQLWLEGLLVSLTLTIASILSVWMINPLIKPLLMLFDEYENIVFKPIDIALGLAIGNVMLLVTRLFYIHKSKHLNPTDVLKMHQIE